MGSRRLFLLAIILSLSTMAFAAAQAEDVAAVMAWEGTLTLPTYRWNDNPYPVFAVLGGGIYYPYPEQDDITPEKADRTYRAVFLENDYLKVTCLPELGGRIHSVLDKTTGEEMFHKNDEIKPSLIAMRGAWVSGGIEWNTGPTSHTVTAVSPVDVTTVKHEDGSASLVINNIEQVFRTRWTVEVTLHPGRSYLDEHIRLYNGTDTPQTYYFWNNTAFPCLPGTRFQYPMYLWTDHGAKQYHRWPVVEGYDLSELDSYLDAQSIFAYGCVYDFFGAYDPNRDQGIVSCANHHKVPGKKAWTWGKSDFAVVSQMALSDAGRVQAQYIEVQTGPLLTQGEVGLMAPHQTIAWDEYWYPVHGLGEGFEYATPDAAIQPVRDETGNTTGFRLLATGVFPGAQFRVEQAGQPILEQALDLDPATAVTIALAEASSAPLMVRLASQEGDTLLEYETPLHQPEVAAPDPTDPWAYGEDTAERHHAVGIQKLKSFDPRKAKDSFDAALELDAFHVPSLVSLASIDLSLGDYEQAAAHAGQALKRDPASGAAWYALGVARLNLGEPKEALAAGHKAARDAAYRAAGLNLAGRAAMRLRDYAAAATLFDEAQRSDPGDLRNRAQLLVARYRASLAARKPVDAVLAEATHLVDEVDPSDLNVRALLALSSDEGMAAFRAYLAGAVGEKEFSLLETALVFADMGLFDDARRLAEAALKESAGFDPSALVYYYLAYFAHQTGDTAQARTYARQAASMPVAFVFPSRTEALPVLDLALEWNRSDANAHLLKGYLLAKLFKLDAAEEHWQEAVRLNPAFATAWRLLASRAASEKRHADAETYLREGLRAAPDDQILLYSLAAALAAQERRPEAIEALEAAHDAGPVRHDITLLLAEYYNAEERFDESIRLLEASHFPNREGHSRPRNLWVEARLARGTARHEAGDHEGAVEDFRAALTYPDNFLVGKAYNAQTAHIWYMLGKACLAAGRPEEARVAWQNGAQEVSEPVAGIFPFNVSSTQKENVGLCRAALEVLGLNAAAQ